jgi:hypothetical protein
MSQLFIKCPRTNNVSYTGISIGDGMNRLDLKSNIFFCDFCRTHHKWNGEEAFTLDHKIPDLMHDVNKVRNELKVNEASNKSYIFNEFNLIDRLIDQKRLFGFGSVATEFSRIVFVYKHLVAIKNKDLANYNKLLRRLLVDPESQYYGTRLEIIVAGLFHTHGINFTMPDPPDFLLQYEDKSLKIECTSRHLQESDKDEDTILRSISNSIEKKDRYDYVDSDTYLFVDTSNLLFNAPNLNPEKYFEIKRFIKESINNSKFGGVLSFSFIFNDSKGSYELHFHRVDSENISKEMKSFMDKYYPIKQKATLAHWRFPKV